MRNKKMTSTERVIHTCGYHDGERGLPPRSTQYTGRDREIYEYALAKVPICDAAPVKLLDATPTQSKHGENWMSRTNDRVRRLEDQAFQPKSRSPTTTMRDIQASGPQVHCRIHSHSRDCR
jgi:hypothetical protein